MAVGIGKEIKQAELITIAGDENRVVNAKNFEDLNNQLDDIREATCSKYHLPSIKERLMTLILRFLSALTATSYILTKRRIMMLRM